MLMDKIGEKIVEKIVEKSKEILLGKGEEQAQIIISEKKNEIFLEIYRRNLDETLLKTYGNEKFYDDLCRVLLSNGNLDILLERCYNRGVLNDESNEEFIERITQEMQGKSYNKVILKDVLKHIEECAFKSFNQIKDPELNSLKNIVKREGDETRSAIKQSYKKVLDRLNQSNIQQSKLTNAYDITCGCKNPVIHFMGRQNDIDSIKNILEDIDINNGKVALWIYGMGGMGKTQLCRSLYYELTTKYKYIGWVSYQGNLKHSLVNRINRSNNIRDLEQEYKNAIRYINSLGKQLVLFIDNYDSPNDCIDDIEAMQCHVIVTSRSKNPDTFVGYPLDFLTFKFCKDLFKTFYTLEDNIIMNEIIHKTGYLALAIELVAKTGQKLGLPLQKFLFKLEERGFDIRTVVKSNWDNNGEELNIALSKHFGIVFDLTALKSNSEAIYILKNFSILPYLGVTQCDIIKWLCLDEEENMLFDLVDSGWLQRTSDLEYMMHPIISYTVKNEITPMIKDCVNLVAALSETILLDIGSNYLHVFNNLPYAASVGEYFVKKSADNKENELILLYIRLAEIYRQNGEYQRAYDWGQEACSLLNYINNRDTGILGNLIYNIMSEICLDKRDCNEECKEWALRAVKSDKENEAEIDDLRRSVSFHNLASAYIQLEDNKNALRNEKKAAHLREVNLSKSDVRLLNVYRNLAMIYRRMKNVKKAYNYQKMVIDALEVIYIDDQEHPDFPVAYSLFSFILRDMGRMNDAIFYQEKAAKIRERVNKNDPKLAINYNNLAMFNLRCNNLGEAKMWQKKAIKTDLKHREKNHPDIADDFFNYAKILDALGSFSQAIKCLEFSKKIVLENGSGNVEEIDAKIFSIKKKIELR